MSGSKKLIAFAVLRAMVWAMSEMNNVVVEETQICRDLKNWFDSRFSHHAIYVLVRIAMWG